MKKQEKTVYREGTSGRWLKRGLLALSLFLLPLPFLAGGEEKRVFSWEETQTEQKKKTKEGDFVLLDEVGVRIFIPSSFEEEEVPEEDEDAGFIAYFAADGGNQRVEVNCLNRHCDDLEEYADFLHKEEDLWVERVTVNGRDALLYEIEEDYCLYCDFYEEEGRILSFSFWPSTKKKVYQQALFMISSIETVEEEPQENGSL